MHHKKWNLSSIQAYSSPVFSSNDQRKLPALEVLDLVSQGTSAINLILTLISLFSTAFPATPAALFW